MPTFIRAGALLALAVALAAPIADARQPAPATSVSSSADAPRPPATWPRTFAKSGSTVILHQPQVDTWTDYSKIAFRAAVEVTVAGSTTTHYGVLAARADTTVDHDNRTVIMTNIDVAVRFPGVSDDESKALKAIILECLPNLSYLDVPLDQVIAYSAGQTQPPSPGLNLNPPPIYYSDVPAILVVYLGQPQFKPVKGDKLMFAANTNWPVILDMASGQYYLLNNDSWLTAADPLKGPWAAPASLPDSFNSIPIDGEWKDIRAHIPGATGKAAPRVLTSTEPAELILTQGPPEYSPIAGTRLMYVSNPPTPLFLDLIDNTYYFLTSGRWFRAANLTGPWSAASADLPAEFAKIPAGSAMAQVLPSVPGTQEAKDAVLLASVPHTATVKTQGTTVTVAYDGAPKFVPIQGTSMSYATNTAYQVVLLSGQYYCCWQGVWFVAPGANGPWTVCSTVPATIYTIPPSCPLYNTTFVHVYSSTPDTVVVGYTSGYSGEYVAATGALMFGAGMVTGALLANSSDCWYGCAPCYYSYGCAASYSYGYGGYYRAGGSCYGPYGGAGWGSSYNPATGTWARGGYAEGPNGARYGAQAYNPFTNTYAAHAGATNGYQSWGASTVTHGDQSAVAAHQSGVRGSTGWAENSSGQWAEGAHSNATDSTVARTSSGDLYAGHDGNVYRKSDGQWQKYNGGGNWSDASANRPAAPNTAQSEESWHNSMQNRAQSSPVNSWNSQSGGDQWRSNWENKSGQGGSTWGQHDTVQGLNQDAFSRSQGRQNAQSSYGERSQAAREGGGGRSWGGGGGRRR